MIHLTQSILVRGDVDDVFRYVSDLSNIEQWDPGVLESRKITPGPVRPESEFRLRCKFFWFSFPMTYRVVLLDAPNRVVFEGRGEKFSARDSISFARVENRTRIEYSLDLNFEAASSVFENVMNVYVKSIGRAAVQGLAHAFEENYPLPKMRLSDRLIDRSILPGMLTFSRQGYLCRKKTFNPLAARLNDRTIVVTGATSGLGKAAALRLARMGAGIVVVGRDAAKVESVCTEIQRETGNAEIHGEVADLAVMGDIRSLAQRLGRRTGAVQVLINNAGALFDRREETVDGVERTLAVNLVGPFLLTSLLIPKLKSSAPSRVVNVSSGGMYTQPLDVRDLEYTKQPFNGENAYARAKRGLVIITKMWAEKYRADNIVFHAMHPGWVATPGIRKSLPRFYRLTRSILRTPDQGADTVVWLAAAKEVGQTTGEFWFDRRPHITDAFPGTRSTPDENARLLEELQRISGLGAIE